MSVVEMSEDDEIDSDIPDRGSDWPNKRSLGVLGGSCGERCIPPATEKIATAQNPKQPTKPNDTGLRKPQAPIDQLPRCFPKCPGSNVWGTTSFLPCKIRAQGNVNQRVLFCLGCQHRDPQIPSVFNSLRPTFCLLS